MTSVVSMLLVPFRFIWGFSKGLIASLLVLSIVLNLAMVTVGGVYAAVSGAVLAVGIGTVAAREAGHRLAVSKAARNTTRKVTQRAAVRTARNASSIVGEAVPFLGVAVIAGAFALEVKDACDTAEDMAVLSAMLDTESDPEQTGQLARDAFDCRDVLGDAIDVPSGGEIWKGMIAAPGAAWSKAGKYYEDLPEFSVASIKSGLSDFVWPNLFGVEKLQ